MITGFRGAFVIPWSQTEVDGLKASPMEALMVGANWVWHGEATRVDGPSDVLVLGQSEEAARIRRHAARVVRRLVQIALSEDKPERIPDPEDPLLDWGFAVTDGRRTYTGTLVTLPEGRPPLVMFLDMLPPEGTELWVTHINDEGRGLRRSGDQPPQVICFTPETMLSTPEGKRAVADLNEGDLIQTKDNGVQPIRWIGTRRVTGARLQAMPELRPIRIRGGAIGIDVPDADLLVSPDHRMVLEGTMARDLFGQDEVLVAAKDMVNDQTIIRDHTTGHLTYVHILLDQHEVVFANGLATESFHPASMPLSAVEPGQRHAIEERLPGLVADGSNYGAFARRMLSSAEAAILMHQGLRR